MNSGYCQCDCGNKTNIAKRSDKRDSIIKGEPFRFLRGHNNLRGKYHRNWKNNPGKSALHSWVIRYRGTPMECEECRIIGLKSKLYHWANISGKYKRDLKDWKRLCFYCHRKFDIDMFPRGEECYVAKLTEKQVIKIRRLFVPYKFTMQMLADKFKVSKSTIVDAIKRRTWRHVT